MPFNRILNDAKDFTQTEIVTKKAAYACEDIDEKLLAISGSLLAKR